MKVQNGNVMSKAHDNELQIFWLYWNWYQVSFEIRGLEPGNLFGIQRVCSITV